MHGCENSTAIIAVEYKREQCINWFVVCHKKNASEK